MSAPTGWIFCKDTIPTDFINGNGETLISISCALATGIIAAMIIWIFWNR